MSRLYSFFSVAVYICLIWFFLFDFFAPWLLYSWCLSCLLLNDPEMEKRDNLLVYETSWDWASNWLNLPISGITEVLGTVHMLSNSDLYPNVWVSVQILAKLNLSAIPRRLAANGNLTHLKSASLFSMVHISRSWLICWSAAKGFADALCE